MKKLIVGNWKMNPPTFKEAEILFRNITATINKKNADIVICPPFSFLTIGHKQKSKKVLLGSQDVSSIDGGSHTGEVSAKMLASLGVSYVIVGHSERRSQGETNDLINNKITQVLKNKMSPILCLGEKVRDHSGDYLKFIKTQLDESLTNISKSQFANIVISYEPIWAIGSASDREATVEEFIEVKIFIKKVLSDLYDSKTAHNARILYGGSVNSKNAKGFLYQGGADGLLVGRDSLTPKKFDLILKSI